MKAKKVSAMVAILLVIGVILSIGSAMAAPTKAAGKNPNVSTRTETDGVWTDLVNPDGVPHNIWNPETGQHAVYVDASKIGENALAAKLANGWAYSGVFPGYIFKLVQDD